MVQIDVPVAFGIGSLFADAANKQLQTGRREYFYQAWADNNVYQGIFFAWIPLYFLMNDFGWETTYMFWIKGSISAYPLYIPLFTIIFFLAANGGFLLGNSLVRAGKIWPNRIVYLAILAYSGLWILLQPSRTLHVGTYEEWAEGKAVWFFQDRIFLLALIVTIAIWAVPLFLYCRHLIDEGNHLD
jgi:hypothetical protein